MEASPAGVQSTSVLFVCLGNICRSPLAEGVFKHLARQVTPEDLERFDHVIVMDRDNLRTLERMRDAQGGDRAIRLLREFDSEGDGDEVPDPYYGGPRGFDNVYEMVRRSCEGLLSHVEAVARPG